MNPTNTTLTVTNTDIAGLPGYDGPYYRFKGNQDPLWNDGSQFASVTLVSTPASGGGQYVGDGILLLKQRETVVSDIIVDDSYSATSPGSPQAFLSGFSWDQAASTNQANPSWTTGPFTDNFEPSHRSHIAPAGNGSARAIFKPTVNIPGTYMLYEWHGWAGAAPGSLTEASNVPCRVIHAQGATDLTVDQTKHYGQWNLLGVFQLTADGKDSVIITNNANGYVIADAFKFEYQPDQPAGVNSGDGTTPTAFELYDNYPNPFNPTTSISYLLPTASEVRLTVYTILGAEVTTLVAGRQGAGVRTVTWDGRDRAGREIPSGVYFYRLEARAAEGRGLYDGVKRMCLIK